MGFLKMHAFPKPSVPLHPVLSYRTFRKNNSAPRPLAVTDAGTVEYTTSGRVGIARVFQKLNLQKPFSVLMPAYHCTAMIEPVIWAGGTPIFYKINADLSVDLNDIQSKIEPTTQVLLVTHYFGVLQNSPQIRDFCDKNELFLVEDCAHTFFGNIGNKPIGSNAHFAIASPWKFFPSFDGGCLVTNDEKSTRSHLVSAGKGFEMKAAINAIENALYYRRLNLLSWILKPILKLKDFAWKLLIKRNRQYSQPKNAAMEGGLAFEPFWADKKMSIFSRMIIRLADYRNIAYIRRYNYARLEKALKNIPGAKPLFSKLGDDIVPYVFPLIVDEPQKIFPKLKMQGVPILRFGEILWPGVDEKICTVSADYSRRVFQFPCHQELTTKEIDWIIDCVSKAFNEANNLKHEAIK